jgi:hypothetical protein
MTAPIVRKPCIFCGSTDRKITGEHVLGNWLTELAGPGNYLAIRSAEGPLKKAAEKIWQTDKIADMKITDVCEECNTSLGKAVERPMKTILAPMIAGRPTRLPVEAQASIALWLYKVGVLYRYMAQPPRAATREELDAISLRHRPLDGTRVHVAAYLGNHAVKLISYQVGLAKASTAKDFLKVLKDRSWDKGELVTLVVGRFAAQIALYPPHTALTYGAGGSIVRQAWPSLGPMDWPPPMHFDDSGLEDFAMTVIP